jgi:hypothetical protein
MQPLADDITLHVQIPGDTLAQLQQEKTNTDTELTKARNDAKAAHFDRDIAEKKGSKKTAEDKVFALQSRLDQVGIPRLCSTFYHSSDVSMLLVLTRHGTRPQLLIGTHNTVIRYSR